MSHPTIAIIGVGRTGGSIGLALKQAGWSVVAAWSRSAPGRDRARALLGDVVVAEPSQAIADLVLVTVPDDAIASVARSVRGEYVAHTSGATSVAVLEACGPRVASLHPLQTLPDPARGALALRDAPVAVTCRDEDRGFFEDVASAWGGKPFALRDEDKAVYHAAAVLASNDVIAAIWAAARLLEGIGVPDAHELLTPIVRTTIENVAAAGPAAAITGPVVRGDAGVVRRHLDALPEGEVREAYRAMARLTAALAGVPGLEEVLA